MFSLSPRRHFSIFARSALAAIFLASCSIGGAQSLNGVNSSGTYGNETIEGTIHFPARKEVRFAGNADVLVRSHANHALMRTKKSAFPALAAKEGAGASHPSQLERVFKCPDGRILKLL